MGKTSTQKKKKKRKRKKKPGFACISAQAHNAAAQTGLYQAEAIHPHMTTVGYITSKGVSLNVPAFVHMYVHVHISRSSH